MIFRQFGVIDLLNRQIILRNKRILIDLLYTSHLTLHTINIFLFMIYFHEFFIGLCIIAGCVVERMSMPIRHLTDIK